jgi:Zn-dependent protease
MADPESIAMRLGILFGSIALHEFGHAKSADSAGDPTPRAYGRVTLNPLAHFDPLGAMMIVVTSLTGFGIGWGRPVLTNPSKMQNPRWDSFMSVLWGPLTNVIIAVVFALIFRFITRDGIPPTFAVEFCLTAVVLNVSLALFNLIPLGPLDGHWLLGLLMPQPLGARFMIWSRSQGTLVLFGLILMDQMLRSQGQQGVLGYILFGPVQHLVNFLLGLQ